MEIFSINREIISENRIEELEEKIDRIIESYKTTKEERKFRKCIYSSFSEPYSADWAAATADDEQDDGRAAVRLRFFGRPESRSSPERFGASSREVLAGEGMSEESGIAPLSDAATLADDAAVV